MGHQGRRLLLPPPPLSPSLRAPHTRSLATPFPCRRLPAGVRKGVPLSAGFAAEALMSLALNLVVLYSFETHRKRVAYYLPLLLTVVLNFVGAFLTGPGLNPAIVRPGPLGAWRHRLALGTPATPARLPCLPRLPGGPPLYAGAA